MPLANFFARSATAASQVLRNFDLKGFEHTLEGETVGVAFDKAALLSAEAKHTLDLAISLLARLYPNLAILPLHRDAAEMASRLERQALRINPEIRLTKENRRIGYCAVVGETKPSLDAKMFFAGSDGWLAKLSSSKPVGSGTTQNPFGAGASACIAAANIFRAMFKKQLTRGDPDKSVHFSVLSYSSDEPGPGSRPLPEVELGQTFLVGLGAIGNGAVWALSRCPKLKGELHLIDPEVVELTNLQRYTLTTQKTIGKSKVDIAQSSFHSRHLRVIKHQKRWDSFLAERNDWSLDRVVVSVDTAGDRLLIQGALPRWIANAWTQPGDLGVSIHSFIDDNACLACLYIPDATSKAEDELIAEALNLVEAKMEIRDLLHTNGPVPRAFIERIAQALSVAPDPLLAFEGKPLRTFYTAAVCGGTIFELTHGSRPVLAEVPLAFQSALAGILVASELVKECAGLKNQKYTTVKLDLLRSIPPYLTERRAKDRLGRCVCQDADYQVAYRRKYFGTLSPA